MFPEMLVYFFYLVVGHALMDFALQGDAMSREKNRHSTTPLQKEVPWFYWLSAHSLIHGGAVAYILHSPLYGMLETGIHWFIDFAKCEKWTNIHQDQFLHVLCKLIWVILYFQGIG